MSKTEVRTGAVHTYSYSGGSGRTSEFILNINGTPIEIFSGDYYTKTDSDGQKIIASCYEQEGVQVVETLKTMADGRLVHKIYLSNMSNTSLTNLDFTVGLDTELDGNDQIPIIADGMGGLFHTNYWR